MRLLDRISMLLVDCFVAPHYREAMWGDLLEETSGQEESQGAPARFVLVIRSLPSLWAHRFRESFSMKIAAAIITALGLGFFFAYVDSRPNFDDTGVLAVAIAGASFVLGAICYKKPWLMALAIGGIVPLHNIITGRGYGSLLALAFSLTGAYLGAILRAMLFPPATKTNIAAS